MDQRRTTVRRRQDLAMTEPKSIVVVQCMSCRHQATLPASTLVRRGVKQDAPLAGFIKRLRCTRCGSGSVMAFREDPKTKRRAG